MSVSLSPQQRAVKDYRLGNPADNIVVEAYAGAGKSTAKIETIWGFDEGAWPTMFVTAKNNHIIESDRPKLPKKVPQSTLHKLGSGACRQFFRPSDQRGYVFDRKYDYILRDAICAKGTRFPDKEEREQIQTCRRVLDIVRQDLLRIQDTAVIESAIDHYGVDSTMPIAKVQEVVFNAMVRGEREAVRRIDFGDMIHLPVTRGMSLPAFRQVFADEFQDFSPVETELLLLACRYGALTAIGDRHQTIYGWVGARTEGMRDLAERLKAKVLGLTVCYRCPRSHVIYAQEIVPEIEPAPGAEEGRIIETDSHKMRNLVTETGDLDSVGILCRSTSPLVDACYSFLAAGIPAYIQGTEIGIGLEEKVNIIAGDNLAYEDFPRALEDYHHRREQAMRAKYEVSGEVDDMALDVLGDMVKCLEILYHGAGDDGAKTIPELNEYIGHMFGDNRQNAACFSTMHKFKGREKDHIYILKPESMPHPKATKPWEIEQERNIMYISRTRAKKDLYLVKKGDYSDVV